MTDIKFCGLTRPEDACEAVRLGAAYVGIVFAAGARRVSPEGARRILFAVEKPVRSVGVFGPQPLAEIVAVASSLGLDVLQLHAAADGQSVRRVREQFAGTIWAVLRLPDATLPASAAELFDAADAVVLDAHVPGSLGGNGVPLPWHALAPAVDRVRKMRRLVVAGGLRPDNVREAIQALRPDVVDVSTGVESAPGIKDHSRMRAFRDAVRAAGI